MRTLQRVNMIIVRTIHEHEIDAEITKFELEMGTEQIICKCGEWKAGFAVHADHVAMMLMDALSDIEIEQENQI